MATTSRVKVVRSAAGGSKHPRTRRRDVAALLLQYGTSWTGLKVDEEGAGVPVPRVAAVVAGLHRAATSRACPGVAAWSTKLVSSQVRDTRRLWASE